MKKFTKITYFLILLLASCKYSEWPINCDRVLCVPVFGQSLAIGCDAAPITTYSRFPEFCRTQIDLSLSFNQSFESSVYGLTESYIDFQSKENGTDTISMSDMIVSFSIGKGSSSIINFRKGTTLYKKLLNDITIANNAKKQGVMFTVPAFCWIQGEQDLDLGEKDYIEELMRLRENLDTDVKKITGQTDDVHCILYQTNQLCPGINSPYTSRIYESGNGGARFDGSVNAQWKLVRDSQYFHLSSPVYPMAFVKSPNNAIIHINSISQKLLGYYEGLALKQLMNDHNDIGLYVTNVTKVDNTHIRLSLHTPIPPIVFDTKAVTETPYKGFSVINSNNENIISGVIIEHNNLGASSILITTSSNCSGAKLRYGDNGTKGYSGFDKGPRGNIRDSQGLLFEAIVNNIKIPMHNWLMFFEVTL